eukprot:m.318587 g.318587  ORF g.318587 m.318587 type:complete len:113 (-) comp16516_c0_seq60:3507-3845(-)
MEKASVSPTNVTLNSVIDAQAKQSDGSARVAMVILDAMVQAKHESVAPTIVSYTSAIDCQAKCSDGDGQAAMRLLQECVAAGLQPNHMTYGCAMNAQVLVFLDPAIDNKRFA